MHRKKRGVAALAFGIGLVVAGLIAVLDGSPPAEAMGNGFDQECVWSCEVNVMDPCSSICDQQYTVGSSAWYACEQQCWQQHQSCITQYCTF